MKKSLAFLFGIVSLVSFISLPLVASIEDYYPQKTLDSPSNLSIFSPTTTPGTVEGIITSDLF